MTGMVKEEEIDWKDTNVGKIGSEEDKALRKKIAGLEPAWKTAGKEPGVEAWRIEQFTVVKNDEGAKGEFYEGDSYIVLHTEQGEGDILIRNIYFWVGGKSTADEYGSAAYKTVELDDFFDGQPTQHREVQGEESDGFKALFASIEYKEGGTDSGFKHVEEKRETQLWVVRQTKGKVEISRVPANTNRLNPNDSFVLDTKEFIYVFNGEHSEAKEKLEANNFAEKLEGKRADGVKTTYDLEDGEGFRSKLEGTFPPWFEKKPEKKEEAPAAVAPSSGATYSLDVLKEKTPEGVDPGQKEQYLSDADFQAAFGMSKADFAALAGWKQKDAKKKVGLF